MNNSTRRNDNIFGISIIAITFMTGYISNNFIRNLLPNDSSKSPAVEECRLDRLCFLLDNGVKFTVDMDDYARLVDNEIEIVRYGDFLLRRRLGVIADNKSYMPVRKNAHRGNNIVRSQLFLDFYDRDRRLIQTIAPHVYR